MFSSPSDTKLLNGEEIRSVVSRGSPRLDSDPIEHNYETNMQKIAIIDSQIASNQISKESFMFP